MKEQVRPNWLLDLPEGDRGLDIECEPLCHALSIMPGIRTVESCCGHGERPYHIWFEVQDLDNLPAALYYFDGCHCGFYGWRVIATTDCAMSPVKFMVEGPVGAYAESYVIAKLIAKWLLDDEVPIRRQWAQEVLDDLQSREQAAKMAVDS